MLHAAPVPRPDPLVGHCQPGHALAAQEAAPCRRVDEPLRALCDHALGPILRLPAHERVARCAVRVDPGGRGLLRGDRPLRHLQPRRCAWMPLHCRRLPASAVGVRSNGEPGAVLQASADRARALVARAPLPAPDVHRHGAWRPDARLCRCVEDARSHLGRPFQIRTRIRACQVGMRHVRRGQPHALLLRPHRQRVGA